LIGSVEEQEEELFARLMVYSQHNLLNIVISVSAVSKVVKIFSIFPMDWL
jgi:hypothetical protein